MRSANSVWVGLLAVMLGAVGCGPREDRPPNPKPKPAERVTNVLASEQSKDAIRTAFMIRCHGTGRLDCDSAVRGPLYLAQLGDKQYYAFASFRIPMGNLPDQPELFRGVSGGEWKDVGPTGGQICVPEAVGAVWGLKRTIDGKCFRPPAAASVDPANERAGYDASVTDTLTRLESFWSEVLRRDFDYTGDPPEIKGPYNSREDAPDCGGNDPSGNAFYCNGPDFIAWDEPNLLRLKYRNFGAIAPQVILAHEWGHAVQARVKWQFDTPVLQELSADCLAGAFMAKSSPAQGLTDPEIDGAVNTIFTLRDRASRAWDDPQKHGAGYQRISAFTAGTSGTAADCRPQALRVPGSPTPTPTQTPIPPATVPAAPGVPAAPAPAVPTASPAG